MKNIVITPKQLKRELFILLGCFAVSIGINIYAIITYSTSWNELFSQIGYVITLSLIIYALIWIVRGLFKLLRNFSGK